MKDLMAKGYPNGILSMQKQAVLDSKNQPDRDVYKSLRITVDKERECEASTRLRKIESKKRNENSVSRRGYDFLHHNQDAPVSDRVACRLGQANRSRLSIEPSRDRIFDTATSPISKNKARMKFLKSKNNRDFDVISGRQYNNKATKN